MGVVAQLHCAAVLKTGLITCAGWNKHSEVTKRFSGTYFIIHPGPHENYLCIKEDGVYDPRQVGLTVEVSGEMKESLDIPWYIDVKSVKVLKEDAHASHRR